MINALSITLSGQSAHERRLETIAQNLANVGTVGYRADQVTFRAKVEPTGLQRLSFAISGIDRIDLAQGGMDQTGNPFDVALTGGGFIAHGGADGPVYTRDGRMMLGQVGELLSLSGDPVLDIGGAPLILDPNAGPPSIDKAGRILQAGNLMGQIGIFTFPDNTEFERAGPVAFRANQPAEPALGPGQAGVLQGFVERSNVDPMMQLARLIAVTREFEAAQNMVRTVEQTQDTAIRTLGPGN